MKLTREDYKIIAKDIDNRIKDNHITNIVLLNSTDFLFSFSFYRDEKLLISLNHQTPFLCLVNKTIASPTLLTKTNEFLRKEVKNAIIKSTEAFNDDRVVHIVLEKRNEFYEKQILHLYIELIPHRSNFIVANENNQIMFATTYTTIESDRRVIKGFPYEKLPVTTDKKIVDDFSIDELKQFANDYIDTSLETRKKEKYKSLYTHIRGRVNSLQRKIKELEKEINIAKEAEIYREQGEMLYSLFNLNEEQELNRYIVSLKDYDNTISVSDNAQRYFKKYKKAQRSLEMIKEQIVLAKESLNEKQMILDTYAYLDENELQQLNEQYMKVKAKGKTLPAHIPSYFIYDGVKIAFGKNSKQNEFLTFKLANKNHTYLHIANYHGSHVVIMNDNPTNAMKQIAAEAAILLSNQTTGDVMITKMNNVKKGSQKGEVLLTNYSTITIHKITTNVKDLLLNSKRF